MPSTRRITRTLETTSKRPVKLTGGPELLDTLKRSLDSQHDRHGQPSAATPHPNHPNDLSTLQPYRNDLLAEIRTAALSMLRMGKILAEAKVKADLLGRTVFKSFVFTIPGLKLSSAYRAMKRWGQAEAHLPEAVRAYALTVGADLAGVSANEPYGRYTPAVKKLGGPPPATGNTQRDDAAAQAWVQAVTAEAAKLYRASTHKRSGYRDVLKRTGAAVTRAVLRQPPAKREQFLRELMSKVVVEVHEAEVEKAGAAPAQTSTVVKAQQKAA